MNSADLRRLLTRGCAELGVHLPPQADDRLLAFVALLGKWNDTYNLTAIRGPADMVSKHLLDSLSILSYLKGGRIVDVGSGAGLPGIPLALAAPDREFVLLDSSLKKTRFLTQAKIVLGLKNVEILRSRAEDYRPIKPFATVISRAFASLVEYMRAAAHLEEGQGVFLAMKGRTQAAEIAALPAAFRATVHPLRVPGLKAERCVVEIRRNQE